MSTNLEYRERERQRQREIRATGQRGSTRKGARAREKKQKEARKFLDVSRNSRAKQRQRNVQKKCAARAKLLFC